VDEEGELLVVQFETDNSKIYRVKGPPNLNRADLYLDGRFDSRDLFEWVRQYGEGPPSQGLTATKEE
jgi:hypothetical protein